MPFTLASKISLNLNLSLKLDTQIDKTNPIAPPQNHNPEGKKIEVEGKILPKNAPTIENNPVSKKINPAERKIFVST